MSICCEVCSGRHLTSACVIARAYVQQCFQGTPDEPRPLPKNVIHIDDVRVRRSEFTAEANSARRADNKRRAWKASQARRSVS